MLDIFLQRGGTDRDFSPGRTDRCETHIFFETVCNYNLLMRRKVSSRDKKKRENMCTQDMQSLFAEARYLWDAKIWDPRKNVKKQEVGFLFEMKE